MSGHHWRSHSNLDVDDHHCIRKIWYVSATLPLASTTVLTGATSAVGPEAVVRRAAMRGVLFLFHNLSFCESQNISR